jgi:polygalacturonase
MPPFLTGKKSHCLLSLASLFLSGICAATAADQNVFNVKSFGAIGDGNHLDTPAINAAIENAGKAGGGTVLVPAGIYLTGSVHLKSNIHLLVDAGATLLGAPQSLNAYDETEPYSLGGYQDGGHCYFHNSLIWGENLTNVFISGNGMISGGGLVRDDELLDKMCGFTTWNEPDAPKASYSPVRLGNKAIALKLCRNVLIRDLTIYHAGHFAILTTGCDNVTMDNLTVDTDRDGIDIDCCRNTAVSNCRINSPNDDALCPKSTYALGRIALTENLTIANCQVSGFEVGTLINGTMKPAPDGDGRIKFGTESSGGFRNCTVANCTFRSCHGLALEEVDGGIMEDIAINNLTMLDCPNYAIYITTGKRNRTPGLSTTSRARNILISNVMVDGVGAFSGIQVWGLPELPVEGLRLDNIRLICNGGGTAKDAARVPAELGAGYPEPGKIGVLPAYGFYARHVKNLELANISTSFKNQDVRPAAVFADVDGLQIDNFKPQVAPGVPAAVITQDVRDLSVRNSPLIEQAIKASKAEAP